MNITARDRALIALTLYGEARSQSRLGQAAVAWTILHRAANPRWWGRDPASCCLAPWQYSCWNRNDPNRSRLTGFLQDRRPAPGVLRPGAQDDPVLRRCMAVVDAVCGGEIPDPTGGATHYFNPKAVAAAPAWSVGRRPSAIIGAHQFYAGVEPGVRAARLEPPDPEPALAQTEPAPPGGLFSWLPRLIRRKA